MNYRPSAPNYDGLWWQIALGIFVGQLMTGALVGLLALTLGVYTAERADKAMRQISSQLAQPVRSTPRTATSTPGFPEQTTRRPLNEDERCIKGERFRRLPNGWEQLKFDPCG